MKDELEREMAADELKRSLREAQEAASNIEKALRETGTNAPVSYTHLDVYKRQLADGRVLDIQRIRDPRAKRIKLSVDERGARLTLPLRASLVSGERFLQEHRTWLATQLEKYASAEDLSLIHI